MTYRPKGLTQQQCADLAGVSRDTVVRYEKGENVSIDVESAILKACGKRKVIIDIDS
jgi:transcriptional regulator with XRE-family HTH domain